MNGGRRIEWVDVYKGIAIFLVVLGHSSSPLNRYIYLFHIAAFFFISGYTTRLAKDSFPSFLVKKALSLLLPAITINGLLLLIRASMSYASIEAYFYSNSFRFVDMPNAITAYLKDLVTTDIGGATWFLVVLFEVHLLARIMSDLDRLTSNTGIFITGGSLILYASLYMYLIPNSITLPYLLDLAFYGILFFIIGNLLSRTNFFEPFFAQISNYIALAGVSVFGLYYFSHNLWAGVDIANRNFGHPGYSFLAAIAGITLLGIMSKLIASYTVQAHKVCVYLGKKTLAILAFHFLIFRIEYVFLYILGLAPIEQLQKLVLSEGNVYWLPVSISAIAGCLAIDSLIRKNQYMALAFLANRSTEKQLISIDDKARESIVT